jgi:hypothetical protein
MSALNLKLRKIADRTSAAAERTAVAWEEMAEISEGLVSVARECLGIPAQRLLPGIDGTLVEVPAPGASEPVEANGHKPSGRKRAAAK